MRGLYMPDQKGSDSYDKKRDPNWDPYDWEHKEKTLRTFWIVIGIVATAAFAACVWATASDDSNKRYVPHGETSAGPFPIGEETQTIFVGNDSRRT